MSIKHQLRGTAVGIFIATSTFAATFYMGNSNNGEITPEQAITYLEEDQFIVLSADEYHNIQTELAELQEELQSITMQQEEEVESTVEKDFTEESNTVEQQDTEVAKEEFTIEGVLIVSEGMTTRDIAEQLERLQIIEDAREFERYILELGIDRRLRMGEYNLTSNMSHDEVISVIAAPN
ncbi:hypothetical protein ACERII_18860 [Evansella sp. AB-rgal1]|uniref:hypothetical protein n=1 Tax=Evansella sp. AB-rgal1 TaxID=3242696 RepID=UPI00359D7476